jgi:hypothetical protein
VDSMRRRAFGMPSWRACCASRSKMRRDHSAAPPRWFPACSVRRCSWRCFCVWRLPGRVGKRPAALPRAAGLRSRRKPQNGHPSARMRTCVPHGSMPRKPCGPLSVW